MGYLFWGSFETAGRELGRTLDSVVGTGRFQVLSWFTALLSTVLAWVVYVPVHEFLHALGFLAAGGGEFQVEISRWYGGNLFARVFPFVGVGEGYAGRLSGFDPGVSDWVLVATDLAPMTLTIAAAYPILILARKWRSAVLFGFGLALIAAPIIGILGDLYEVGSVIVTRILLFLTDPSDTATILALRHDDLPRLLGDFSRRFPESTGFWGGMVALSVVLGWVLAGGILTTARLIVTYPRFRKTARTPSDPGREKRTG